MIAPGNFSRKISREGPWVFLKASSADAGRFENLMRKGEKIIKEKRLGYALFTGVKD